MSNDYTVIPNTHSNLVVLSVWNDDPTDPLEEEYPIIGWRVMISDFYDEGDFRDGEPVIPGGDPGPAWCVYDKAEDRAWRRCHLFFDGMDKKQIIYKLTEKYAQHEQYKKQNELDQYKKLRTKYGDITDQEIDDILKSLTLISPMFRKLTKPR